MSEAVDVIVPHIAPTAKVARALLIAMRRIAAGGIDDASAANLMIGTLGIGYRRPLMFLRVLMEEVSRTSQQSIAIAPCCCPRMTEGEAALLLAVDCARTAPDIARTALARITGSLDLLPAVSIAQALADALDDAGRPFEL